MKKLQLFVFITMFLNCIIVNASSHASPTKAFIQRQNENRARIAQQENKNSRSSQESLLKTWPLNSTTKRNSSKVDISCHESYTYSSDELDECNITQSDDKKIKKVIALYKLNEKILKMYNEDNSSPLKPKRSESDPQLSPSYKKKLAKKLQEQQING